MKEQVTVSRNFKIITLLMAAIGAVTIIMGLITDHQTTWANYLIVNYQINLTQQKLKVEAGIRKIHSFILIIWIKLMRKCEHQLLRHTHLIKQNI